MRDEAQRTSPQSRTRIALWFVLALVTVTLTIAVFLPVGWFALLVEKQTDGRLTLGDPQGSFWRGSAFIGAAAGPNAAVTPLFEGRFHWKISPLLLLGQIELEMRNEQALLMPLKVSGSISDFQLEPGKLLLPPERLEGLGAPLNTIGPSGKLVLSWERLQFARLAQGMAINGTMQLDMQDMASRLSPIHPLGSYRMRVDWRGERAELNLSTLQGPMLLSGTGSLLGGRFQFSGKAEAEAGQEERLANLLNLLGQRRRDGDRDVIALEFK